MSDLINPTQAARSVLQGMQEEMGDWRPTDYNDHLIVNSEHVLIAADTHIPAHDEQMIAEMLDQAYREEVDTIIWAGDLMDMQAFSSYGIDDETNSFRRDLRITGALLRGAARMGFKQIWTLGNHENRIRRTTKQSINMEQIALMAGTGGLLETGELVVSDNPSVYLPIGNWMVTHPAQYSSFPGVVASKLATRYQCNVIAAHEHHFGMVTDETGQWLAISSGGLYDPRKHRYINHNVTAHRAWQRGFVILHSGKAQLYRGLPTPTIQTGQKSIKGGSH